VCASWIVADALWDKKLLICQVVTALVEARADVNIKGTSFVDTHGATPLMLACIHGSAECVQTLLTASAQVFDVNALGHTALHFAAEYGVSGYV